MRHKNPKFCNYYLLATYYSLLATVVSNMSKIQIVVSSEYIVIRK